jgi:hypothetical protein
MSKKHSFETQVEDMLALILQRIDTLEDKLDTAIHNAENDQNRIRRAGEVLVGM